MLQSLSILPSLSVEVDEALAFQPFGNFLEQSKGYNRCFTSEDERDGLSQGR